jgi:RNA polymerase sigma-70 factor (sigma-E family)
MRSRDDAEFASFVAGSQRRLRGTAYLLCGDWALASDIVQEALIRVYVAWPRLEARSSGVHAYARRCVVNVAIDRSRKHSSSEVPAEETRFEHAGPGPDLDTGVTDRQALVAALRQLAPRQRACVVLRYFEDQSVSETARLLSCSEGTVKSQTARALVTLRHSLALDDEPTDLGVLP